MSCATQFLGSVMLCDSSVVTAVGMSCTSVPPRGDVEHLRAAADCEDRQILFHRAAGEIDLELVAPWLGVLHALVAVLAVENRIDVAAAGQQHSVERSRTARGLSLTSSTRGRAPERSIDAR